VSNGGKPDLMTEALFAPFDPVFFERANIAKDVGSYFDAAKRFPCDLMVFLGGSTYIRGANWLKRIVQSFTKHGDGLYGTMHHNGVDAFGVKPHIRTSGFWMPPALLCKYPEQITREDQRYPFEHGANCLTSWVSSKGLPVNIVTWTDEYPLGSWAHIPNGFHAGNQEGLILGDRMSRPPFHPIP
jgi:hypothetical protein